MSVDATEPTGLAPGAEPSFDAGLLGVLPHLNGRQVRLERRLGLEGPKQVEAMVDSWNKILGGGLAADRFGVQWRAAGLKRPGVVAHFFWPRLRSRVALGIDPPLAHALVDRLLGFERTLAEARLQISPVEWGVLGFLIAAGAERLEQTPGPIGAWDLVIDRVGPDSFDIADLGPIVTWRWRVRVGSTTGSARLWMPESLLIPILDGSELDSSSSTLRSRPSSIDLGRFGDLTSEWRAEVGTSTIASGLVAGQLQPGRLLLIDDGPIGGTIASPEGELALVQNLRSTRCWFQARVEPGSSGDRLIVTSTLQQQASHRNPIMADVSSQRTPSEQQANPDEPLPKTGSALESNDVSVTLTVELGRVSLPLRRLAELGPGDVVELARHGGEPVDLSSNGRLVARGQLVQVDTELGVRIIQVFF